jgi:hypothetical protein
MDKTGTDRRARSAGVGAAGASHLSLVALVG